MPVATTVRGGLIVAVPMSLVLLSGAPSFAATLSPGDACTTSSTLDPGLTCLDGVVAQSAAPSPEVTPSVSPASTPPQSSSSGVASPVPTPVDSAASAVTSSATSGGSAVGGAGGSSASSTVPAVPVATAPAITKQTPATSSSTGGSKAPVAKSPTTGNRPQQGMTLLSAADLAMAPPGDLPSRAAIRSVTVRRVLDPGAVQSPELAGMPLAALPPAQAVAAVQGPLLAAEKQAAQSGGFRLLGLGGQALPGLLIGLATAIVAAVGAGNVRVWQTRLTDRRRPSHRRPRERALTS